MIKLFADGADWRGIEAAADDALISGFTTNPTLMKQAGVTNYTDFATFAIAYLAKNRPETSLSLEVFADDEENIIRQARKISDWGDSVMYRVYVKIPVMYTDGKPTYDLIKKLSAEGINLNVTAVFTIEQCHEVIEALDSENEHILSIFAGRIADAGFDPIDIFDAAHLRIDAKKKTNIKTLWASSREAYNYVHAARCGADIITMTPDLIKKVKGFGKDLTQFSLETCRMFHTDAAASGFEL
jgi:transaldolase